MKYMNKKFAMLASVLVLLIVVTGCGEKKETERAQSSAQKAEQSANIEISVNENAQEIKVKEKKVDSKQSKSYYYDYNIKSEYDPNARPANEDASVRVKPRTTIDANIHVRSPYEKVQISMLVKKLSKTFRVKCSACHDDYANGIIGPSLLSRDSNFIYNRIAEFKSGKKSNPLMTDLINQMTDEEIRTLADEIYAFNKEVKKIRERK